MITKTGISHPHPDASGMKQISIITKGIEMSIVSFGQMTA